MAKKKKRKEKKMCLIPLVRKRHIETMAHHHEPTAMVKISETDDMWSNWTLLLGKESSNHLKLIQKYLH